MTATDEARAGVLLMTYGSPSSPDDVARYLAAVRGGRPADAELVAEFRRRYEAIGGSPLIPITRAQAAALEARFGGDVLVRAAMRFSEPSIETALRELVKDGVGPVAAIVLSPQYSPMLMGGYGRAIDAARAAIGDDAPRVEVAGAWFAEPALVDALAERIRTALAGFPAEQRDSVPILLTAHSLPLRVAREEPAYIAQLADSADLVATAAGLDRDRWTFCWQSAGHEPGDWMKPDFADLMPTLKAAGHRSVLIAPIQFLADHLEILYDVEIGARAQAEAAGLVFRRIRSLNTDPALIDALEAVTRRSLLAVAS
ncbi:MAG TPA: ferrochelatase [Candidatus Limnocylindrales bacterium]|nr:ferrochelatase [Candidatus Limnocylindrales bacterium]